MPPLSLSLADTILARYPDPDGFPYRRWCYSQGYVLCGFEKLWETTRDDRYLNYVRRYADQHVTTDGSLRDFTGESLDDIMAGTVLVAMYQHTGARKYRLAADRVLSAFTDYPRNGDGGFWHNRALPGQMWIDGVFMGQMFLTRYGAVIGEAGSCFSEAARQIAALAAHCRKAGTGLFLHAYDETRQASWADPLTGLSPEVWSEGLGWYALILVETLALMPPDHPGRGGVFSIWQELAEGLRNAQDPRSGLWYQVVDKGHLPDNWHDTSGSAMFTYALQRAADLRLDSAETCAAAAQKGYAGIRSKTMFNAQGLLDIYDACDGVCVQDSYKIYINYPRVVNAKEAVGGVLWASTEVEKPGKES